MGTVLKMDLIDEKLELTNFLNKEFDDKCDHLNIESIGGASYNADVHWKLITAQHTYGLKGWKLRDVDKGAERESLGWKLADLLCAPDACKTRAYTLKDGAQTNVIKHMVPSCTLGELGKSKEVDSIRDSGIHPFFEKYGQWTAFCMVFDVRDRHANNCVCAPDGSRVCMIDLEDSFIQADYRPLLILRHFLGEGVVLQKQLTSFQYGYTNMYEKIKIRQEQVKQLVHLHLQHTRIRLLDYTPERVLGQLWVQGDPISD